MGYSPWGHKELDTAEQWSTHRYWTTREVPLDGFRMEATT